MTKRGAILRKRPDKLKPRRGRPKGSTVPIERDRQARAVACWWAFREFGFGPYEAAHLAATVVSDQPIKLEDVEGLLRVASTEIKRTASSFEKHIDTLVRKAERHPPGSSSWLAASALAIKALILALRKNNTAMACWMLDVLIRLGWKDQLARLTARITEALKSNVPPRDTPLGRAGRALLAALKQETAKKP